MWPVCSPSYLRQHGAIEKPADMLHHSLLHCEERYRSRVGWRDWLSAHQVDPAGMPEDFVFTDALNSLEAAVQGQGIALGWKHLVEDHVRGGRLVPALHVAMRPGPAIHIVMPAGRLRKPGAELFRDWLLAQDADLFTLG